MFMSDFSINGGFVFMMKDNVHPLIFIITFLNDKL